MNTGQDGRLCWGYNSDAHRLIAIKAPNGTLVGQRCEVCGRYYPAPDEMINHVSSEALEAEYRRGLRDGYRLAKDGS